MVFLLTAVLCCTNVFATENPQSFEPTYSYEQPNLSVDLLRNEMEQFEQWNEWEAAKARVEEAKLQLGYDRRAFDRAKSLFEKEVITEDEYVIRGYNLTAAEFSLAEAESLARMARVSAEIARFDVLDEGNAELDVRRELTGKLREYLVNQRKALEMDHRRTAEKYRLLEAKVKRLRDLVERGIVHVNDLETKELNLSKSGVHIRSLRTQTHVLEKAIQSFDRSLERLRRDKQRKLQK